MCRLICRPTKNSRFCYQNIKSSKSVVQTQESIIFSHEFISILLIFCDCSLHFSLFIYPQFLNLKLMEYAFWFIRAKLFLNPRFFHIQILNVKSIMRNHPIKSIQSKVDMCTLKPAWLLQSRRWENVRQFSRG
jgi:hypothetical protein